MTQKVIKIETKTDKRRLISKIKHNETEPRSLIQSHYLFISNRPGIPPKLLILLVIIGELVVCCC